MKEKKPKNKSFFETVREVDELEAKEREELRQKYKEQEQQQRTEYEKQLSREKIELLKDKQGYESNIENTQEIKKKRGFFRKIGDFLFYHKWWLIPAIFAVGLATFLTTQLLTRERADLIVLLITDDTQLQDKSDKIEEFFEQYCEDYNKNGKVEVSVYNLPINDEEIKNDYVRGNSSSLNVQLQMGEAVLVISDDYGNKYMDGDKILLNLQEQFPDCDKVKGTGLYLSNTIFTDEIGYDGKLDDDICLEIREVKDEYSFKKKMQKKFNQAYPVLEKIINDVEANEK